VFNDKPGKMPKNHAMCMMISKIENDSMCMLISNMEKDTMWWIRNMEKVAMYKILSNLDTNVICWIKDHYELQYDLNYSIKKLYKCWIMKYSLFFIA
jgi:hypothetical protein